MIKNFPKLVKENDTQVQEGDRVPHQMTPKRPIPTHIIIKMAKVKENENLKSRKTVTYKGAPTRLFPDFSTEPFQARRD